MKKKINGFYQKVMDNKVLATMLLCAAAYVTTNIMKCTDQTTREYINIPDEIKKLDARITKLEGRRR
jgi:hypothetical protein